MTSLLLSTRTLPAAGGIAAAARRDGWQVYYWDETLKPPPDDVIVYYGGSDVALAAAARFDLALLEPPFDLLARLPGNFLQRSVEACTFKDLQRLKAPTFVKPADSLNKTFDAGIYSDVRDIRFAGKIPDHTPVLIAEPVTWLSEFRCFVLEGRVVASSPYLCFGRPSWKPFEEARGGLDVGSPVFAFCKRLLAQPGASFPPAFVVDVGMVEERGWAVVEFNPVWCAGVLGADPCGVLPAIQRGCRPRQGMSEADWRWVVDRS